MTDQENHFTVFVRLPFKRDDFVDPPQVDWSAAKEKELWDIISRQSRGNEIDWRSLADQFQVTQQFLLQQSAWLYERQLSQVRAQMRRMGNRQSVTPSPTPNSASASVVGVQPPKRPSALSSRGPSRLSTQTTTTPAVADTSAPNTPQRSRTSLPLKSTSGAAGGSHSRGQSTTSVPLSRRSSKDNVPSSRNQSRRGSVQYQMTKSPAEMRANEYTSSEEEETLVKASHRRPNPASAMQRRSSSIRKSQHARQSSLPAQQLEEQREDAEDDDDDDDDDPAFLPFASAVTRQEQSSAATHDPSATLRGGFAQSSSRPTFQRNLTSERVKPGTSMANAVSKQEASEQRLGSSNSSLSSNNATSAAAPRSQNPYTAAARRSPANLPTPLSPRQQAALAAAAGLSPRRRSLNPHNTGSESSPSMGSSFSDLDDASVTQSALEEALMSNMGSTAATMGGVGGGIGSRVSGISQALRSRYFDARSGTGQENSQR